MASNVQSATVHGPIAITLGDPAGIGPEIIAKAFRDAPDVTRGCFVAGDVATMRAATRLLEAPGRPSMPVALIGRPEDCLHLPPRCLPVLQVIDPPQGVVTGHIGASAGRAAGR
jgi:4-hydroxythreonine-4-phosphate dehydrogenase